MNQQEEVNVVLNDESADASAVKAGEYQGAYSSEDFTNLATDDAVSKVVLTRTANYFRKYEQHLSEHWDEVLSKADLIYRCYRSDTERDTAQTDDTEADTGCALGFVMVRVLASQIASIALSKEDPFKYIPVNSEDAAYKAETGELMARQYNLCDRYAREQEGFEHKFIDAVWKLVKYENIPIAFHMIRKKAERTFRVPTFDSEGNVVKYEIQTREVFTANYPTWDVIPPENFMTDKHGDDLEKKPCVIVRDFCTRDDLLEGKRSGEYVNIDKIKASHIYVGDRGMIHAADDRQANANLTAADDDEDTATYERYHSWLRLPINQKTGKLDHKERPRWYWSQIIGSPDQSDPVLISCIRNPDPDDELPYMMWHHLPDDGDMLYHMGMMQAIESDIDEAVTTKNQAIDQKSVMVRRPLIAVEGEVYEDDLTFSQDKVFHVANKDSISDFTMQNVFPDTVNALDRIESDLRRASSTDKPIVGEALGQRTSATESQHIYEQALKPQLILMKYTLNQFFQKLGRKRMRYWQRFALPQQIVEISGAHERQSIKPADLYGEYDVRVEVVYDFEETIAVIQGLQYAISQMVANPQIAKEMDLRELYKDLLEKMRVARNASKYFKPAVEADAERVAELENHIMMDSEKPQYVEVQEMENRAAHLKIHNATLHQYDALPQNERPPQVDFLRYHTQDTKYRYEQESQGGGAPVAKPNAPGMDGELSGDRIAAQAGSMAGRPSIAESTAEAEGAM